jgi:hypothetical protein
MLHWTSYTTLKKSGRILHSCRTRALVRCGRASPAPKPNDTGKVEHEQDGPPRGRVALVPPDAPLAVTETVRGVPRDVPKGKIRAEIPQSIHQPRLRLSSGL